jgi:alkylhydroperoxidase family enzyme
MSAFVETPRNIPWPLRLGIWIAERATGRKMLPARILSWYPQAALGSGVMEALVAHEDGNISQRLLKPVRMSASFATACPFCIDMNSFEYARLGISDTEALALRPTGDPESVPTFSARERLAIRYARLVSQTPLNFPPEFIGKLTGHFHPREIVILASTAAQVNYWARLIQALGIRPAGFSEECPIQG